MSPGLRIRGTGGNAFRIKFTCRCLLTDMRNPSYFEPGNEPWNKGIKGLRFSPATEFKPGNTPANKVPIGTEKIRYVSKTKSRRVWVKIAENGNSYDWRPRSQLVYEEHHGEIPDDFVVHQIDGDPLNDHPENLEAISRADHLKHHLPEFEEKLRRAQSRVSRERWRRYYEDLENKRLEEFDSYYWQSEEI